MFKLKATCVVSQRTLTHLPFNFVHPYINITYYIQLSKLSTRIFLFLFLFLFMLCVRNLSVIINALENITIRVPTTL